MKPKAFASGKIAENVRTGTNLGHDIDGTTNGFDIISNHNHSLHHDRRHPSLGLLLKNWLENQHDLLVFGELVGLVLSYNSSLAYGFFADTFGRYPAAIVFVTASMISPL